ncbi:hypothetical protein EcWSU1_02840 [Enterobacter ludwigii]|uniref:Uncharacterized protein n=1 Tax=Enterobacter ludwigii TaxID=299767 RepID=G8LH66_9ENTR|nr:hypothetical protein EcWSU1_02840 [Enterobacter ludwigii]
MYKLCGVYVNLCAENKKCGAENSTAAILFLCIKGRKFFIDKVKTFACFPHQRQFIQHGFKQFLFFVLLCHVPLQEIKGRIILADHCRMNQFVNFLRNQLLVLIGRTEELIKRIILGKRGRNVIDARQAARVSQIIKQTLHVGHLFLRVAAQEGGSAFKTVVAAPGAHLLVEKG